MSQIFAETASPVLPVTVYFILLIDQGSIKDLVLLEEIHDVRYIFLTFLTEILIGCVSVLHVVAKPGHDLFLFLFKYGINLLFHGFGLLGCDVVDIDHIVVKQGKIHVKNRDHLIVATLCAGGKMCQNNTGQTAFQDIVGIFLQVTVNGQIDVISRLGIHGIHRLDDLSQIIDQNVRLPFGSPEHGFHGFLDAGLSYDIVGRILLVLLIILIVFLHLTLGDYAGVTHQIGKIHGIIIFTQGIHLDLHSRILLGML